ncbi:MAG TPA: tRNA (adenosine(37)-N6)-threonylcarbamoyltransferase complex ATPase subunit type 1 TsaE [Vitreimonas sp.]|nr:tRNA (adenosine(37)-N6)-threonylcarbamoyltransferase complex ATPase subunit type 1 TsaE [Vitreimonas sp.]
MTLPTVVERELHSPDPDTTRSIGAALARLARAGDRLLLWGELGAGKTQVAKGFGAGLGITTTITSPTFILMAEYDGRLPLFHLDLYRLAEAVDAWSSGLVDERQEAGVTLIEWPDRLGDALPPARLDVVIVGTGDEPRRIRLRATDAGHARYLDVVA